ncbi:ribosome maturation factor RimM [Zafaria sp. Z1313]|uniref:ribosome maturation factor RimM n=1 Tax=unclassified Zafaria TaxID=2828765 RepID=UPI002E797B71|nr:ribosome maturation factor RimM [Zafaria sp. J156]MEE1620691.1 ribosome maturation factor RimM [Zafaria sp. J156]
MRLQVARIGKPHGIRGEVTVQVMTDSPAERFVPGAVLEVEPASPATLTVEGARWNKDILLIAFEEVLDRNAAEALRGAKLFVESDDEADDDPEAWYEHELVGLEVRVDGRAVGKVAGLRTMTVQDLLVLDLGDGEDVLVPFVEAIVPEVDVEAGFVVLTPPPGLLELNRGDEATER